MVQLSKLRQERLEAGKVPAECPACDYGGAPRPELHHRRVVAMSIKIRSETPADAPEIEAITARAFSNAPHTNHAEQ
jgi:hypothetical protein